VYFCINYEISHLSIGKNYSIEELADIMINLQRMGCHNINLVTPTHYLPHIVLAIDIAASNGLEIPIVYNTHGYENVEIIKKINGIIDIYMPDIKFFDVEISSKFLNGAGDYFEKISKSILEMYKQVGVAIPEDDGILRKGLLVRHLVLPNHVEDSKKIIRWIYENLPKNTYLNIMSQYRPVFKAIEFPEISRTISYYEYYEVVNYARQLGFTNLDIQGF